MTRYGPWLALLLAGCPTPPDPDDSAPPVDSQDSAPPDPNQAPSAAPDTATVTEHGAVLIEVLHNDSDPDGDRLRVGSLDDSTTAGVVWVHAGTALIYDPSGAFGELPPGETATEMFAYTASDGDLASAPAAVTVTVTGGDDPPVAVADSYSVDEGGEVVVAAAAGVLANDADPDGDALQAQLFSDPARGAVTLGADGGLTYVHDGSEQALVTFRYQAGDGALWSDPALVSVAVRPVNDAPAVDLDGSGAGPDRESAFTEGDGPVSIVDPARATVTDPDDVLLDAITATLTNPLDGAGERLDADPGATGISVHWSAGIGVLTLGGRNSVARYQQVLRTLTYDNTAASPSATARVIAVVARDRAAASATATATVTVQGADDPPVAVADTAATTEEDPVGIDVAANDTDPEGEPVVPIALDPSGTAGAVVLLGDDTVEYDPDGAFEALAVGETATDTFTYTASDGGLTAEGVVTVTVHGVNDAPVAGDDAFTVTEDTLQALAVLADDSDVDGDPLVLQSVSGGTGTVAIAGPNVRYDPAGQFEALAEGASTTDTFTYVVADPHGGTDGATVTVTVTGVNDGPDAVDDAVAVGEDDVAAALDVLDNDSDPDDGGVTVIAVTPGSLGSVTAVASGGADVQFTPDPARYQALAAGGTGHESLVYTVSDGAGAEDDAAVLVTVQGANDAPVAGPLSGATTASSPVSLLFDGSDIDSDDTAASLTYAVVDAPAEGSVTNHGNGSFTFDPDGDFDDLGSAATRDATFTYEAVDGHGAHSTAATATITVSGP